VNAATDWRRSLRRRQEQPLDAAAAGRVPQDGIALADDRDLLLRALSGLPPKRRAVLVLRYWEELPDSEIAAALNCCRDGQEPALAGAGPAAAASRTPVRPGVRVFAER